MPIQIIVNGKKEEIAGSLSVQGLLESKKIRPEVVTVELNGEIITRDRLGGTNLKPEDVVEFVFYMGGGLPFSDRVAKNITELIGQTPIIQLNRINGEDSARVLAKLEMYNPGGSVKDRICLAMIEDAESKGLLKKGAVIIEPTSGNTGIGLAMISAVRGYRCILTMPETMSLERMYILKSYGAEVVLTPGVDGMQGSIKKAESLLKKIPNSFMPQQFNNESNPEIHRKTTAQEILSAVNGNIDVFVAGVGTGGTITGIGEVLKKRNPDTRVIAVEPKTSAVLSGEAPGPHKIQGIGAGFIPGILNKDIIDEIITVEDRDAFKTAGQLARQEGLFVGISAGAAAWAALNIAKEIGKGKTVVVIFPDTGERYFSMQQYFEA